MLLCFRNGIQNLTDKSIRTKVLPSIPKSGTVDLKSARGGAGSDGAGRVAWATPPPPATDNGAEKFAKIDPSQGRRASAPSRAKRY